MSKVFSLDGRELSDDAGVVNLELVELLRTMLAEAEAGRLVCMAGVIGSTQRGKLDLRMFTHTNNWEVHDRLLARVGVLRTMMEQDLLERLVKVEPPLTGGGGDGGDGAA